MLGQDCLNTGIIQAVIDRQDMGAGHAEDVLDPQSFHVSNDEFADLYFHNITTLLLFRIGIIVGPV